MGVPGFERRTFKCESNDGCQITFLEDEHGIYEINTFEPGSGERFLLDVGDELRTFFAGITEGGFMPPGEKAKKKAALRAQIEEIEEEIRLCDAD